MNTAELHIAQSSVWATALVAGIQRAGFRQDPFARIASMLGADVPASRIRSLVVRPHSLKTIASHIREGLADLYAAECARQQRKLEHEIAIAKAAGAAPAFVSAAARLGGVSLETQGATR